MATINKNFKVKNGIEANDASTIVVNSSSNALRITQTGAGNALVVEDSANPDGTAFTVKADGSTNIANSLTVSTQTYTPASIGFDPFIVVAADANQNAFRADGFNGGTSRLVLNTSKGAFGVHTVVASGDMVGEIRFAGSDGTTFIRSASIQSSVDGTPGTNDMPGRLVFLTTADGASIPTERMRVDSSGNVGIGKTAAAGIRLDVSGKGAFSDVLTAPTAAIGTNTTQVATTQFVTSQIDNQIFSPFLLAGM